MKYLNILLFPLAVIISCASEEPAPMAEVEIKATIGPLCPVANVDDQTPCGYSVAKLNEIYGAYTLKILAEKDGSEVFSAKLTYPAVVVKELPQGNYNIKVSNQTTTVNADIEAFVISSYDKKVIELNIDTGIR